MWRRAAARARGSATVMLVWACLAVFVLVFLLDVTGLASRRLVFEVFGISRYGIVRRFWLHQFVTSAFLHGGLGHLIFNLLTLWMLGPGVERTLGRNRYLFFSALCAVCGFAGFLLFSRGGAIAVGYSGVIYGILVAQAVYFPNNRLFFFGLFPMRMKHAVLALGAIALYLTVSPGHDGIAHAAHLFGALGAFIYLKLPVIRRPRRRTAAATEPPEEPTVPEPPPVPDWGRPGDLLTDAIAATSKGDYEEARRCLTQTRFPRKLARMAGQFGRLVASAEQHEGASDPQTGRVIESGALSLWNDALRQEVYVALPALASLGLHYGEGIIEPVLDALCSPESNRMPTNIRQSLESVLNEAGDIVLTRMIPRLSDPSVAAQRAAQWVLLLPSLNLRKYAPAFVKSYAAADSRERDCLATRLAGIKAHSPGALCDLLAGILSRLPPDPRLARDLGNRIGTRELEGIATRWASGGHRGAQTVLERLYDASR
jgi:membrane associated rhomboid family serine protease